MQSRKNEIIAFEKQSGIRALGLRRLWNNLILTGGEKSGLGDNCAICAEVMDDQNALLQCPRCENWFHRECICQWVRSSQNKDCPMCRLVFKNNFCSQKREREDDDGEERRARILEERARIREERREERERARIREERREERERASIRRIREERERASIRRIREERENARIERLRQLYPEIDREDLEPFLRPTLRKTMGHRNDGPLRFRENGVFFPDGRFIAFSRSNEIYILDWRTEEMSEFNTQPDKSIMSLSISSDGTKLAAAYPPVEGLAPLKIWNVIDGIIQQPGLMLEGHSHIVTSVSFSPDGTKVASGSDDNTAKLWDVTSGECLQTLEGHSNIVTSVSFSPDGTKVASGSRDKTVKIWDVEEGRCRLTLKGHEGWINALSFSPDGTKLVSGGYPNPTLPQGYQWSRHGMIIIWDIAKVDRFVEDDVYEHKEELDLGVSRVHRFPSPVEKVAFSPVNNRTIAVGCRNGIGWYLNGHSMRMRRYMFRSFNPESTAEVNTLAFSPDGRLLACGGSYGEIGLWNIVV